VKTDEFRAWLEQRRWKGKPLSSVPSRISKARRFEKAMPALGFGDADLDAAFEADGMAAVTEWLRQTCRSAADTGAAPGELVGETTNASMRINNVASAVRNYRQFRDGDSRDSAWPELEGLRAAFLDTVPEFERFTRTDNAYERIERDYKDAMARSFREVVAADGDDESTGRRVYRVLIPNQGPLLRWQTDDDFARKYPELAPAFYAAIGRLSRSTGSVVDAIMAAVRTFEDLRARGAVTLTVGQVAAIAITVAGFAHPLDAAPFKMTKARELATLLTGDPIFRGTVLTEDHLVRWLALHGRIFAVMRDEWQWEPRDLIDVQGFAWMALDDEWMTENEMDDDAVLALFEGGAHFRAAKTLWTSDQTAAFCTMARAAHDAGLDWYHTNMPHNPVRLGRKPDRERRAIATLGYLDRRSEPRIWLSDRPGRPHFGRHAFPLDAENANDFSDRIISGTPQISVWREPSPQRPGRWPDEAGFDDADDSEIKDLQKSDGMTTEPTNLILYGPPGTGKTYATAEHAVRLCGERPPADRAALMARYKALGEAGRIEFVTFHQSMAYEDFVEGLRPVQGGQGNAGFELQPTPGIFRLIARRAETSTGPGDDSFTIGDRQVFKMSIGEMSNPDDAYLFEEAIAGGFTVLGFSDVDWSNSRFAERQSIIDAVREEDGHDEADATSGRVQMPHIFRNWMKPGDVVIASKGNTLFRAIGEITGDYEFHPREDGRYAHRRAVRWMWIDREGVPVSEIYRHGFTQKSAYALTKSDLNIPALERYANSQQDAGSGGPEPFVLVIDEINRANISKVFGELITLLEADKRLGAANELKVRLPYSSDLFGVPANLHIIGTMNTADRSIALIDKALRRRFTFTEMMPDYTVEGMDAKVGGISLARILETINDRIEYLLDREHQIGHGWLLGCGTKTALDDAMRMKIIPLIAEYFFEDWGRTAEVLGGRKNNPFLDAKMIAPPPGMKSEEPRVRWSVKREFDADAYARLVASV